jgi:hypothetical protein
LEDFRAACLVDLLACFWESLRSLEHIQIISWSPTLKLLVPIPKTLLISLFSVFSLESIELIFRTCLYEFLVTCLGFASNTFSTSTPVLSISRKPWKPLFESMFFELLSKLWSFGVKFYGHLQNILEKANVEVMHWLLSADWTKEEKVKTWSNKVQLSSNFIFLGFWGVSLICPCFCLIVWASYHFSKSYNLVMTMRIWFFLKERNFWEVWDIDQVLILMNFNWLHLPPLVACSVV